MTTKTVKQAIANTEVTKPVVKAIELDLDKALTQVWNRGLLDGILGSF